MVLSLVQNASILIALSVLHQVIVRKWEKDTLKYKVLSGALFGCIGIAGMLTPVEFEPGVFIDGRSIILCISGLFGGPVVASVAAAMCAAFRLYLGGPGAPAGIVAILEVTALGVGYHFLRRRNERLMHPIPLLGFGFFVYVAMMVPMLVMPGIAGGEIVRKIALPVLLVYPPAMMLLARILTDNEERGKAHEVLRKSEEKYRNLVENSTGIIWETDVSARFTYISGQTATILGYDPSEMIGKSVFEFMDHGPSEDSAKQFATATENPGAIFATENRLVHRDGHIVIVETRAIPIFSQEGVWHGFQGIDIDITERKRAEDSLRENRERLDLALKSSKAGTWDRDILSDRSTWDDYVCSLFGMAPGSYSGKLEDFLNMVHPDDREGVRGKMATAVSGDAEYSTTYRVIWPDSSVHFLVGRGKVYRDSSGRAVRMIGINLDVTELKQAEEALRESQQQLADIIDFLPDATFVIDKEGRVIAWNRAIEELTGIGAQDILGKGNYEYALPFYGKREPILIDLVLKTQKDFEAKYHKLQRKDTVLVAEAYMPALKGGEVYLYLTASILRDSKGNIVGAIESMRDITERRRVEEALVLAEEKYRSIFENAMEGIYQTTLEGRCIDANPALAGILGYDSPKELMHTLTDITRQLYVNPERRTELLRLIAEHGSVKEFETQYYRKDGSTAWVSLNMHAVRDADGELAFLEGTVQDITDRKALEARLVQAQKMEAIGTLAGGIAHDFNNILAAILGYTELTDSKIDDPALRGNLEQVLKACDRAKQLIAQILTFSRTTEPLKKPINTPSLISEALNLLRATIPSTIQIFPKIDPAAHTIFADPAQIHGVLINLCTNAAHAMRETGGVLEVGLENVELTPQTPPFDPDLPPGPYVKLTVGDTGNGITPEVIHRIFDPFFTTKNTGEGTGLGLSVVYGIVKGSGGTVTVQSNPGKGTVFSVYLPAVVNIVEAKVKTKESVPKGSERILFIDDEEVLAKMWCNILEDLGYRVTATTRSVYALEMFRERPDQFDLVITDMTMPGMMGTELSKEILQLRPDMPIILCTGFNELITEEKAKAMGIREFAMKPLNLRSIAGLIRKALEENRI